MVDPLSAVTLAAPVRSLGRDADLYVDELYQDAPSLGATMLVAHTSRYVCDLNRAETDLDALSAEGAQGRSWPHGLIWRSTTDDQPAVYAPLGRKELERRLDSIYRPYHRTLAKLIEHKRKRFGFAILLCGHSMPSQGRAGHTDEGVPRADVVPGSRGYTTAAKDVINSSEDIAAVEFDWSVKHDDPYRGGFSTTHYGRPSKNVHALQIELARRLYMNEETLSKKPSDFKRARKYCSSLVAHLGALSLR
jgi:N-formylglutamate amidohydrolase